MKIIVTIILLLSTSCATVKQDSLDNFENAIKEPAEPIGGRR